MALPERKNASDLFADIREGFAYVAANAKQVTLREDMIPAYADTIEILSPDKTYDGDHHFLGQTPEEAAAYVLTAEAVNFGSAYKGDLAAEGFSLVDHSIYFTVTTRLKAYFEAQGIPAAGTLAGMDENQCAHIFGFNLTQPTHRDVNKRFCRSMNQLGQLVTEQYRGSFLDFLTDGKGSARTVLGQLARLPYYNDVHDYKGRLVPIFKRAQHTLAVLDLEFNNRLGYTLFDDPELMTMFADNAVPHVLRMDGILEYSDELVRKVAAGEELPSGSIEEIEIRCCAGHAVELIAAAKGVKACDIDFNLWHRSVEDPKYREKPTHITRTIYY